jgi:PTH1 family peptidyl-tRNA hydrolase
MRLIVGLGNPGRRYQNTRHNIGARLVELLAQRHRVSLRAEGWSDTAALTLDGARVLLARPQTYVNVSGTAVADLRRRHRLALDRLLVVFDDLDLPLGNLRIRGQGGHGGHNGMRSIIEALGGGGFPRLRIGIGRPPERMDPADYVLSRFSREEQEPVAAVLARAADAVELFAREGVEAAMRAFNVRPANARHGPPDTQPSQSHI